ncbi:sugar phosphate nucleotidyltransferase [Candidatus Pelagibacter sp.]|nr:sugar phosphate nucleotidyltransferase [Candidatus Pelagibacter sp.]
MDYKLDIIFLCGGKGTRLRPYTNKTPKPLLLVNNKPFLYHLIKKVLKINKFENIILAGGYKVQKIREFIKKDFKGNNKIKVINSGDADIIQRIKDSSKFLKNDFMICYGDTYVDLDLKDYIERFNKSKNPALMTGSFYQIKYGTVEFNKKNNLVKKFKEKPIIKSPINLGYFLFHKKLVKQIFQFNSWVKFLETLSKKKKMELFITNKKYFSFDSPVEYNEIKKKF